PAPPHSGGFASPTGFAPSGVTPSPPTSSGVGKGAPYPARATTAGFGPPPIQAPPFQAPPFQAPPGRAPYQPVTAPVGPVRRRAPRLGVLMSMTGASLAGALILLWWLLPWGDDTRDSDTGASATTSPTASAPKSTVSPADATPATQQPKDAETGDMLTPDGIRTAIKAFEKETDRDMFGDFSVYPDYVSAQLMVKGSDTKYDTYTYRPGQGVEKGIIKGTLAGGEQPVSLDDFNWDKVPALLKEAAKKLNVADPENRYLLVRQPNDIFGTPAGIAVYLSDEYSRSGYLEADTDGKVTRVMPAED
ncbi:serine/threonine protein kinase, partial [Streptomyces europaeiscabiei]|nr:serine/threonine protein kinase [Streptomyces europaeiscabiei]